MSIKLPRSSGEIIGHQRRNSQWQRVHPEEGMAAEPAVCTGDAASQGSPRPPHASAGGGGVGAGASGARPWGGRTSHEPQYEILLCPLKEFS